MVCPDCGYRLVEVASAAGVIARCYRCGGFWLAGETANKLTAGELTSWRRISVSSAYLSGGKGVCPADGMVLTKYVGEQVPANLSVMHCQRCGKWWFPGDNLFNYKPAAEAKMNYFRLWGIPLRPTAVLLPMLLVTTLLSGVAVGVTMVQMRQRSGVSAQPQVTEFSGSYLGGGKAIIGFRSQQEVIGIEYREAGDGGWKFAKAEAINEFKIVNLTDLIKGKSYVIRVSGEEFGFVAR